MNIKLYRSIFNNKLLSNYIFNFIHEIQINRFSLKYDDIVDVGWMCKNGYESLARDKIKRNYSRLLYVDAKDLFSHVANSNDDKDINIFTTMFEQNEEYFSQYFYNKFASIIVELKNIMIIKYLFINRGYGIDINAHDLLNLYKIDLQILKFLLVGKWFKPTHTWFIHKRDVEYSKEIIDLIASFVITSPITEQQEIVIISALVKNPIPFVYSSLVKNTNQSVSLKFSKEIENIKYIDDKRLLKNLDSLRLDEELVYMALEKRCKVGSDDDINQWINHGEKDLFALWTRVSKEIKVVSNDVILNILNENGAPITKSIGASLISRSSKRGSVGGLNVIDYLINHGYQIGSIKECFQKGELHAEVVKLTSQKDRDLVLKLSATDYDSMTSIVSMESYLIVCCGGQIDNFKYFFPIFKESQEIFFKTYVVPVLYRVTIENQQRAICQIIDSYGYKFSDYSEDCMTAFRHCSFGYMSADAERLIQNGIVINSSSLGVNPSKQEICIDLLSFAITHNDYIGVKYMFSVHRNQFILPLSSQICIALGYCHNASILDYILTNFSIFFDNVTLETKKQFFESLSKIVLHKPLKSYLNKYIKLQKQSNCTIS